MALGLPTLAALPKPSVLSLPVLSPACPWAAGEAGGGAFPAVMATAASLAALPPLKEPAQEGVPGTSQVSSLSHSGTPQRPPQRRSLQGAGLLSQ